MNIFKLDESPARAAEAHHWGHCAGGKLILESAQLLSTAVRTYAPEINDVYRPTHIHHPCTLACTNSREIFLWTANLAIHLNNERCWRYNKQEHKSLSIVKRCLEYIHLIPEQRWEWPLAMPEKYKTNDPVESYRRYYIGEKQKTKSGTWMMYYAPREIPEWMPEDLVITILEKQKGN